MSVTKVPKSAKKVFKGVLFDVYQWPQRMYDGSVRKFEVLRRQDTVIIIPTIKDKIVVTYNKQPRMDWHYSFPAGRNDKAGESPRAAALRELLEETGLKPKKFKLWKKYQNKGKIIHNVYVFIAQDCQKVAPQQLDGGEKIKLKEMSFEQMLLLTSHKEFYRGDLQIDLLLARLNKKYKKDLKKVIFK
jgi:ADP-ribose pyrophosphatase